MVHLKGRSGWQRTSIVSAAVFVTIVVGGWATRPLLAQTFSVLHNFKGGDGANPMGPLLLDAAGDLYGTAIDGGYGYGTIFELSKAGVFEVLYTFDFTDGSYPTGGVVGDAAGDLYGTTGGGGPYNYGVAFKLMPSGEEIALHLFADGTDGAAPDSLIRGTMGNLYGVTYDGGDFSCPQDVGGGCGTVFTIARSGAFSVLYSFAGGNDGALPEPSLIEASDGNLYGATNSGGDTSCFPPDGCGTVFRLTRSGVETVLYRFTGQPDGAGSKSLIRDGAGNFYGVTGQGGQGCTNSAGCGTVFELSLTGAETVLYRFGGAPDGEGPVGIVLDSAGNLYGTTQEGGDTSCNPAIPGCGTVFKLDRAGNETVIHTFTGSDGAEPASGLVIDSEGNLYGTTANGGAYGYGVIFKISLQ